MPDKIKLKPCPFCGSITAPTVMNQNEAQWLDNDIDEEDLGMVVCCATRKHGCGASTGFCDTAEQAAKAWNKRAPDWIPCSERLPESDCCVRVATESGLVLQTCFSKSENRFVGISRTVKVTCWMPLPTLLEVSCDA